MQSKNSNKTLHSACSEWEKKKQNRSSRQWTCKWNAWSDKESVKTSKSTQNQNLVYSKYFLNKCFKPCYHQVSWKRKHLCIWSVLRDLVPFAQFKKHEKHSRRNVTFSKVAGFKSNTPSWKFFTFFKLYKWFQIAQSIIYFLLRNLMTFSTLNDDNINIDTAKLLFRRYKYLNISQN